MLRQLIAVTIAGALLAAWTLPAVAQQNGIVIQNNGVDSSDSAAGADNVQISNNPGNAQSATAGGVNNEDAQAVRAPRDRDRKDRSARNADEGGGAVPADTAAAPVEGELQAYTEGGEAVDPSAAPVEVAQPTEGEPVTLQLPNTGIGSEGSTPLAALAGMAALAAGAASASRRLAGLRG